MFRGEMKVHKKRGANKLTNKEVADLLEEILDCLKEQNYGLSIERLSGLWEYFADIKVKGNNR